MIDCDPKTIETNYNNSFRRFRSFSRDRNNKRSFSSSRDRSRSFSRHGRDSSTKKRESRTPSGGRQKEQSVPDSSLKGKIDLLINKISFLEKKVNDLADKDKVNETHFNFDDNIQINFNDPKTSGNFEREVS